MSSSSSLSPPVTPPTSDSEEDGDHSPHSTLNTPGLQPTCLSQPISLPSPHPFAASTKADRPLPLYEKKLATPPTTPPEPKKQTEVNEQLRDRIQGVKGVRHTFVADVEQKKWDAAISSAIDRADTKLDLSSENLTYIPSSISDLKNLVVLSKYAHTTGPTTSARTFCRSTTAPALLPSPHIVSTRPFLPSRTTNVLAFGGTKQRHQDQSHSRSEIELYLMRNAIRTLPSELFGLDCLVVLSLRQNKLTSLPPVIGRLSRLRELNVANNRLNYLPAEILRLRLTSLHLHPNPFTQPPESTENFKRCLGPLERTSSMPTLSELILRFLLAPAARTSPSPTRLETDLTHAEIEALSLPPDIRVVVRSSTLHGRLSEKGMDAGQDITANVCPRMCHHGKIGARGDHDVRVFYTPVEERLEWVGEVAGVRIAESRNGWVPVLWRGCERGCLDFLEDGIAEGQDFEVHTGEEEEEFEFSDEE